MIDTPLLDEALGPATAPISPAMAAAMGVVYVFLDYETQSACDLKKCGTYVYAQHPSTRAYCAALRTVDAATGEQQRYFWTDIERDLTFDPDVVYVHGRDWLVELFNDRRVWIIAHNVAFEHAISTYCLKLSQPVRWIDTMDLTLSRGLPGGADAAGSYLFGLPKDKDGYALMMRLCKPRKTRSAAPGTLPYISDREVQALINYVFRDVEISYNIAHRFGLLMNTETEQRVRDIHTKTNFRGINFDRAFAEALRSLDEYFKEEAGALVERVTGGAITRADLTRNDFLREALNANLPEDLQLQNMQQATLEDILEEFDEGSRDDISPEVETVIRCRLIVTRAALSKVETGLRSACDDGYLRAQLRYWGAITGRWSGNGIQIQNFKRPAEDLDLKRAIRAIELGAAARTAEEIDYARNEFIACTHRIGKDGKPLLDEAGNPLKHPPYVLLGSLIRGVLIPSRGCKFVVGDFASVEARGLLWLAGDMAGLKEYIAADNGGADTYTTLAATMFQIAVGEVTKKQRGGGKVGILACGYGGGSNAVSRMAFGMGIDLDAMGVDPQFVVDGFRTKYPLVVKLWRDYEDAFRTLLKNTRSDRCQAIHAGRCVFTKWTDRIEVTLPSGRILTYMNARLRPSTKKGREGRDEIVYDTAVKGAVRQKVIYGGLIAENCWSGDTKVLTSNGYKPIASVTSADLVWDGVAWVTTKGAINQGEQEVGSWLGTVVTAEHKILAGKQWKSVIAMDEAATQDALSLGRVSVPSPCWLAESGTILPPPVAATVASKGTPAPANCSVASASAALTAATSAPAMPVLHAPPVLTSSRHEPCATDGCTATPESSPGATTLRTAPTPTMAGEESACVMNGEPTPRPSSDTPLPCLAGTSRISTSTEKTTCAGTNPATSAWSPAPSTLATGATTSPMSASVSTSPCPRCASVTAPSGEASTASPTTSPLGRPSSRLWRTTGKRSTVFDLLDCGPRNRFTVLTAEGPVIVHNCTQALCRDALADVMIRAEDAGWTMAFSCHDELILDVPDTYVDEAMDWLKHAMRTPPAWAVGFPLFSKPEIMLRYGK